MRENRCVEITTDFGERVTPHRHGEGRRHRRAEFRTRWSCYVADGISRFVRPRHLDPLHLESTESHHFLFYGSQGNICRGHGRTCSLIETRLQFDQSRSSEWYDED